MSGQTPENPEDQGLLFSVDLPEQHEGDFSSVERAEHIVAALDAFDQEATLMALLRKFNNKDWLTAQQAKLGKNVTYKWRRETHEKHQDAMDASRAEFRLANPFDTLLAQGLSQEEAEAEIDRRYDSFQGAYRGTSQGRIAKRDEVRQEYLQFIHGNKPEEDLTEEELRVEAREFLPEQPNAKVSLARALRPEFNHLDRTDFADIDPGTLNWLTPALLRETLMNVSARTQNARWRTDEEQGRVYTVFIPGEWKTLLRSDPAYLADAAFNASEDAQRKLPPTERDLDAPQRAKIGSNRRQAEAMRTHIEEDLDVSLAVIARFKEAAQYNGGLARFGNEANMRVQLDYFWNTIVGDMLWVTRIVRKWSPEQEDYAMRALKYAVHLAPDHRTRMQRMIALGSVGEEWLQGRKDHMLSQALEAEYYADQQEEKRSNAAAYASDVLF
jgi:hypothetical protein